MSEIELHRKLLGDAGRNAGLHEALRRTLRPGMTVIDVGAGTGFLSLLARRLGAAHCTLIEYSDAIGLARELARRNRVDGLDFIQGHSREVRGLPKADVVISETLGNFALEEGLLETLIDARRFLKPGGTLIPARLRQFVAPVGRDRIQKEIDVWPQIGFDLDLEPARRVSLNNLFVKTLHPDDLCGPAREWDDLDFAATAIKPPSLRSADLNWRADELNASAVHGFAVWWRVDWLPGLELSTAPDAPPTHWEQVYLPLLQPLPIVRGSTLTLRLNCDTRPAVGLRVQWEAALERCGRREAVQKLDSFKGRL